MTSEVMVEHDRSIDTYFHSRSHEESARDQDGLASNLVDPNDCRNCGKEHSATNHAGRQEGVGIARETKILEDSRSVVQNSINTSPLH